MELAISAIIERDNNPYSVFRSGSFMSLMPNFHDSRHVHCTAKKIQGQAAGTNKKRCMAGKHTEHEERAGCAATQNESQQKVRQTRLWCAPEEHDKIKTSGECSGVVRDVHDTKNTHRKVFKEALPTNHYVANSRRKA